MYQTKERNIMERIAIIDHDNHRLYVEDINEEVLNEKYNGEEEVYIRDNYSMENFSWDYITGTEFFPEDEDPITVDFEDLL